MRYRALGSTGLEVSEIGFGTIPVLSGNVPVLPRYFSPDVSEATAIMEHAFRLGCNFYDTAIPSEYGDAEYKLGRFAEHIGRENIIISDKARAFDGGDMYNAVLGSCENLGSCPDIYFVHQADPDNADRIFQKYGALDALCDLKKEGKIGFTGIASHYYDVLLRGAQDDRVDVLQGSGNIMERGMLDRISAEESFRRKGFVLNKVYAAGVLIGPFATEELIGGVLGYPISSALIGIGTVGQADSAMSRDIEPKNIDFETVLDRLREHFEPIACTRCQRCSCPHSTDISTIFRQYNYYYLGKDFWALKKLSLNIDEVYENCRRCVGSECERSCPMGIHIPETIEKVRELVHNNALF